MNKELELLDQEFKRIRSMGYVKATRGGYTGIGHTFETLLGKSEDTKGEPDYHGIEIKTKRAYSKAYITLFNATPMGIKEGEAKRLQKTYGYPDEVLKKCRVLNVSVQANSSTLVANRYLFKIIVDYEIENVRLFIYDKSFSLIDATTYWDFKELKRKLGDKLQYLAVVKAWPKRVDGVDYYKYYDIDYYKLKNFDDFLKLLNEGTIRINFKYGVYRDGFKAGEVHDRGTSFEIEEVDLLKLFEVIKRPF